MIFWIFWGIDIVVAAVALFFFVVGLGDGSVSSFNMGLWLLILAGLAVVLWGAHALRQSGRRPLGTSLAAVVAVPGIFAGLMLLLLLVTNPRWN